MPVEGGEKPAEVKTATAPSKCNPLFCPYDKPRSAKGYKTMLRYSKVLSLLYGAYGVKWT
jgi:hypothetical protein